MRGRHEPTVQRIVVFIDESSTVQCYGYSEDIQDWDQSPLGEKWNITTSPDSKLSATFGPDSEMVVSYQDPAGRLAGVMGVGEAEWKTFGPLDAEPIAGTPQHLEVIDGKLHLFYVLQRGGIGYHVLDPDTGNWQGEARESSHPKFFVRDTLAGPPPRNTNG